MTILVVGVGPSPTHTAKGSIDQKVPIVWLSSVQTDFPSYSLLMFTDTSQAMHRKSWIDRIALPGTHPPPPPSTASSLNILISLRCREHFRGGGGGTAAVYEARPGEKAGSDAWGTFCSRIHLLFYKISLSFILHRGPCFELCLRQILNDWLVLLGHILADFSDFNSCIFDSDSW